MLATVKYTATQNLRRYIKRHHRWCKLNSMLNV